MLKLLVQYTHWLHTRWPSATVEKLPVIKPDGTTTVPGVYIVGDLTGVPLLKFALDSGAKAIQHIIKDERFRRRTSAENIADVIIIGAGVAGISAALEAKKAGLNFQLIESNEVLSTIANFPAGKPIYTYPDDFSPASEIKLDDDVSTKERLIARLRDAFRSAAIQPLIANVSHVQKNRDCLGVVLSDNQIIKAHAVVIAIGRSGNYRRLDVPDTNNDKVLNRLHDAKVYADKHVLVVGGGDSALETAVATAQQGAHVTLSYRKPEFSRPKVENIEKAQDLARTKQLSLELGCEVVGIEERYVRLKKAKGETMRIKNDTVFAMLGREAPLDFFRRSKIPIAGESSLRTWLWLSLFFVFVIALYDWKNYGFANSIWGAVGFPENMPSILSGLGAWWQAQISDRSSLLGVIATSMKSRSFYYTFVYTSCVAIFGWLRIKRRNTAYVRRQTITLFLIQLIPLFLLPELFLPWLGYNGFFDAGTAKLVADSLFPSYISAQDLAAHNWPDWGHPRAYWHAYGFILAWPLNVYNVFTPTPMAGWLIISFIQTFIIIPLIIYKWGKGAYCGWICSCGALAETLGDTHRHKMPHGAAWNKLNMLGQVILLVALLLLVVRIGGWLFPESWMDHSFDLLLKGENSEHKIVNILSWKWSVDVLLGGILGVGLYFKYSGRVWCRFACPLAALMHIYARFSRFRIFSDKKKCISCNACTGICHQGVDVMNFANKGLPMQDPQCVRCSACIQVCPTGVLRFGELDPRTGQVLRLDKLLASPLHQAKR